MPVRMIRVDQRSIGHGIQFRWGAIFSGAFVTLGFCLFFLLLGNAVGLSVSNSVNPAIGGALRFWSWLYLAVTLVFSYYLGGFLATRSNEITSVAAGGLHGIVVWGLASVLGTGVTLMVSPAAVRVFQGIGPNSGNWLAICVIGFGLAAAIIGGASGKESLRYVRIEEGREGGQKAA